MAEPIALSEFDAPAKPAAQDSIPLDQFDSPAQAAPSVPLADFDAPEPPIEERAKRVVVENIPDSMKYIAGELGEYLHHSGVFNVLEKLSIPQRGMTAGVVKGLDITNLAPGIQGRLNPTGNILPKGLAPHDVIYDFLPSNKVVQEKAQALADKFGIKGDWAGESARLLYAVDKGLLGLVGDFALDPINLVGAGLGKAAETVAKFGKAGVESAVAQKTIQAAARGVKSAEEVPIVGSAIYAGKGIGGAVKDVASGSVDVWNSLLPYTRIKDLDETWILHSAMSKGINPSTVNEVLGPIKHVGVTSSEGNILFDALENVTNSASKEDLIKAIGSSAEKQKLQINPSRQEQLADVGQHLRGMLEKNIEREVAAGVRSAGYGKIIDESPGKNIRAGVIEGYIPHRMSDEARSWAEKEIRSGRDPKKIIDDAIRDEMTKAGIEVSKGTTGSWVSDFDIGRLERKIRLPVKDANEYLKNRIGLDEFFVTDPISATARKIAETKKLALDKGLLDTVKKYGVSSDKAPKGWKPIEHRSLSVTENLKFPPEIADKIGFYLDRPKGGLLLQKLDQYQWLFKKFALAKPDYYLQNIGENSVKAMALGAEPRDFAYVTKVMGGNGSIPLKAKGMSIPAAELRKEIIEYGIDSGGVFKEGFDSFVHMGQKMTRDGIMRNVKNAPSKVMNGLMEVGERGENWSRRAFYISLRRRGMNPREAAITVERILFDYGRVTPAMNVARRFVPFIQPVIKTAAITPELLRKNPRLYNFLNNNMFQAMQSAFNDDTTKDELMALMGKFIAPRYRQIQDPTFSVLLPGNSWLGKYLVNQGGGIPNEGTPWQGQAGGNVLLQFKAPIQFDILNQLNIFDDSIATGMGAGPALRAASMIMAGRDLFTGKELDITKDHADVASRFNAAANTLIESSLPFPNLIKQMKKWAGIGDPKWIEPATVLAIHGTSGRFVTVTNLDKDFFLKMLTMKKYHEQLIKEFMSRAASESRNAPSPGRETINKIREWSQMAFSSKRVHKEMLENASEMQRVNMARAGIIGKMKPEEILKNIRLIEKNIKELNQAYQATSEYRLKALGEAKATLEQLQGKEEPEEPEEPTATEESDGEALSTFDTAE